MIRRWNRGSRISPLALVRRSKIDTSAAIKGGARVYDCRIGRYSYIGRLCLLQSTTVGAFCSVADNASIGLPGHSLSRVATSPVFSSGANVLGTNLSDSPTDPLHQTSLGHDVWVGLSAIVLGGVSIGTGAVIGAGAVVTKDVPAYAVVVGNPARLLRYRFDAQTISSLLDSDWWSLPEPALRRVAASIDDVQTFLGSCERTT